MKELEGSATAATSAPAAACVRFFLAVGRYPDWHSDVVRRVDVLDRDGEGTPTKARAKLQVTLGPVIKDFDLVLAVTAPDPATVCLTRIPHDAHDPERFEVTWRISEAERTRIRLDVRATLSVPRLLPVAGLGDRLAEGFVTAAVRALGA